MEIGFEPKEIIQPQVCRLNVLAADKAEDYGLQIGLKLKVVGGEHNGHTFMDYANRDEVAGQIKQGSKAWSVFEACLGTDFYKRPGVELKDLGGKQFVAQVTQTRTGSRNKVEFGTIGCAAGGEELRSRAERQRRGGHVQQHPALSGADSGEGFASSPHLEDFHMTTDTQITIRDLRQCGYVGARKSVVTSRPRSLTPHSQTAGRCSEYPGWIKLHDLMDGSWHEIRAAECLPSAVESANKHRKRGGGGR